MHSPAVTSYNTDKLHLLQDVFLREIEGFGIQMIKA